MFASFITQLVRLLVSLTEHSFQLRFPSSHFGQTKYFIDKSAELNKSACAMKTERVN